MATTRLVRHAAWVVSVVLLSSCGSSTPLTEEELSRCLAVSNERGSIGGSSQIVSLVAMLLPDDAIAPAGSTDEEIAAKYDQAFTEQYGIDVDAFLALRRQADDTTVARLGEPPGVGELVGDEWFLERDAVLLDAWNEQHPQSARDYCELVTVEGSGAT